MRNVGESSLEINKQSKEFSFCFSQAFLYCGSETKNLVITAPALPKPTLGLGNNIIICSPLVNSFLQNLGEKLQRGIEQSNRSIVFGVERVSFFIKHFCNRAKPIFRDAFIYQN